MRLVRDATERFHKRPYFELSELEGMCLSAIHDHCRRTGRPLTYPLSTDVLMTLIEEHAESLDLYADLSDRGHDVEGITEFFRAERPRVSISRSLSEDPRRELRLRTTLAHEFCHVHIHNPLFQTPQSGFDFFQRKPPEGQGIPQSCGGESIISARKVDWMEWQAGYVCGALLMPRSRVRDLVDKWVRGAVAGSGIEAGSEVAEAVANDLASSFQVSMAAARVRLAVLRVTSEPPEQPTLFDSLG